MLEDIVIYKELAKVSIGFVFHHSCFFTAILFGHKVHTGGAALSDLFIVSDNLRTGVLLYPTLVRAGLILAFWADYSANQSESIHCLSGHTAIILMV